MGQTILLADDSITIQKVIELTFSDEDFQLHTVGNGQKAIDEIRTVKPDIVLCDIIMPEKNGYEVCEFIKTQDDLKQIPVLLLTGAFEPFDQERARQAGCDGFLAKPFEPQTLISKVRQLLASANATPAVGSAVASLSSADEAPGPATEPPPAVAVSPVTPSPVAPLPLPTMEEGATVIDEGFAVEAGERELSVDAGDQTVLLGMEEPPTVPSEDIWSQVQETAEVPPSVPEQEGDDAATVFMTAPPEPEPVESTPAVNQFDEITTPSSEGAGQADDGAWVLPEEGGAADSGEPELTPLGDFGGFDDFAASGPASTMEPESIASEPPPLAPPTIEPEPVASEPPPLAPPPVEPAYFAEPEPVAPEPVAPEPVASEPPPLFEPEPAVPDALSEQEPVAPEPPPFSQPAAQPSLPSEPTPLEDALFAPPEPSPPIQEDAPLSDLPPLADDTIQPSAVPPEPTPVVEEAPEPVPELQPLTEEPVFGEADFDLPSTPVETAAFSGVPVDEELELSDEKASAPEPETTLGSADIDAIADKVAERLVQKLSETAIKEIAWEVVPDLARTLIQKEIDALKAKIPK